VAPIPDVATTGPDVSGTYWFAIPLGGLASGEWQLPVQAEVGPTTAIATITFTLAPDRSISWS
ncbi:MAG TPA: hypothetical protein VKY26_04750, partial [Actinomycetota bacterium]|nr:hypothetical protein [Actinomycetota bacterium]